MNIKGIIINIKNFIMGLFLDEGGAPSMGRMLSFLMFFLGFSLAIITRGADPNSNDLIKWIFGIALGGKTLQSFAENIGGKLK